MKGRKPKPDATRRRRNARPSLPYDPERAKTIDAPPKMGKEARAEWNRVVGELQAEGAATNWDRAALVDYCHQWERWQYAEQKIKAGGLTQVNVQGIEVPSVWLVISNAAHDRMVKLQEKLRLFPVDRARTPIAKPKAPTPAAPPVPLPKAVGDDPRRVLQMPAVKR